MQVCSQANVFAQGENADGRRQLMGLKVGDSETECFWSRFNCCAESFAYGMRAPTSGGDAAGWFTPS
jgi:hypothetical protein